MTDEPDWYSYTKESIHPELHVSVNRAEDEAKLHLNNTPIYAGDHDGLLEVVANLVEEHGHTPLSHLSRDLNGQCLVCDDPMLPAIHHTGSCHFCEQPKPDAMAALDLQQRLVQGQSCVQNHYVCSSCYCARRPDTTYIPNPSG